MHRYRKEMRRPRLTDTKAGRRLGCQGTPTRYAGRPQQEPDAGSRTRQEDEQHTDRRAQNDEGKRDSGREVKEDSNYAGRSQEEGEGNADMNATRW